MATEYEIYQEAHNLVAEVLDSTDMDDFPGHSKEVIDAYDNLSNKHADEAKDLADTIVKAKSVHGNLLTPNTKEE